MPPPRETRYLPQTLKSTVKRLNGRFYKVSSGVRRVFRRSGYPAFDARTKFKLKVIRSGIHENSSYVLGMTHKSALSSSNTSETRENVTCFPEINETDPIIIWLRKYIARKRGNPIDWEEIRLALNGTPILPPGQHQSQKIGNISCDLAMETKSPGEAWFELNIPPNDESVFVRLSNVPQGSQGRLPSEQEPAPGSVGLDKLSRLPSEILYKITTYLDDVGFVCLRNTHRRLRSNLDIDSLSVKASGKYIIRGLMGLHGIPNPTTSFCPKCTERSRYWRRYPDEKPTFSAIQQWRKSNVYVNRSPIVVQRQGHFCNVGTIPKESQLQT